MSVPVRKASSDPSQEARTTMMLLQRLYADYVRPYLMPLIVAVIFMAVSAAGTGANAWLMEPILDDVLISSDQNMLIWIPAAVVGVALIKGGSDYLSRFLMGMVGHRVIRDLRKDMFSHLMRSDLAFYTVTSSGRLISHFISDVNQLETAASNAAIGLIKDSLVVVCLITVMFIQDWRLACIAFIAFPLALVPIVRVGRRMRQLSSINQKEMAAFTGLLGEVFQNAREVKIYGAEPYETSRSAKAAQELFSLSMKGVRVVTFIRPLMEVIASVMIAAIVMYGGYQVAAGHTTPGAFTSFITAMLLAYQPMKSLASINVSLQRSLASAQRIFTLLDLEPSIRDRSDAVALPQADGKPFGIEFQSVTFSYDSENIDDKNHNEDKLVDTEKVSQERASRVSQETVSLPALEDVSLIIPGGQTVALVGPSGSGKSTFLNLIGRFYDVVGGVVRVGGVDVRDLKIADLRSRIALVSQDIGLFDTTVAANIAYGQNAADHDAIVAAAKKAAADEFIRALPHGYDTRLGERGVRLSGGQRQRIAIARAFFKDAPILLLDEATSALDSQSEDTIQSALSQLTIGRTTVVIAHRLSTVRKADTIVVFDQGRIIEMGSHDALQSRGGLYARLCRMQFHHSAEDQEDSDPSAGDGGAQKSSPDMHRREMKVIDP